MTATLDLPPLGTTSAISPAERLRATTTAVRVSFTWLGTRKTLSPQQRAEAADSFGAEQQYFSAAKKLLDTTHPAFRNLVGVKSRAIAFWKGISLPYVELGVRLIRQDHVAAFDAQMTELRSELHPAAQALERQYGELREAARQRLGRLFNAADYPPEIASLFDMSWDFPSVEPPRYLEQLHPEIYAEECRRVAARFDEAIQLTEQMFIDELRELVSHLTERLAGEGDGKAKVFRDSAITNLTDFFARFSQLNVRSNPELEGLVRDCQSVVRGVAPQSLRDDRPLRERVHAELGQVQQSLDDLMVERPRRSILRRPR